MHEHRALPVAVGERSQHAVDMLFSSGTALYGKAERLVENQNILVLEQRHLPQRLGVRRVRRRGFAFRGALGERHRRHADALARFEAGGDLDALAVDAHFTFAHDLVEVGLRQVRVATAEPPVEAHPRLVLADRDNSDHVSLRRSAHANAREMTRPSQRPRTPNSTDPPA